MNAVAERVKKVFSIQEERKRQYVRLERAHSEYCSKSLGEGVYRGEMEEVTSSFAQLSQDMITHVMWFRENGQTESAGILENLQQKEKEKLQLTVQYQVKRLEKVEREGQEEDEEVFSRAEHEERELRRRLADIEGAIAGLLTDLRFEPAQQKRERESGRESERRKIGQLTMKLAGYLLVLCSVLHGGFGLMVALSEPGAEHTDTRFLSDSPRSIPLVTGRSYSISCEGTEWSRGGVAVMETPLPDGVTGVHVVSSGDMKILMFRLFNESLEGQYVCRNEGGEEFVINVSTGNPVLIPSREVLGLERSLRGSSLPFFGVFGSGDPQPLPTDYSWYFNGDPIFINGEIDNSAVDVNAQFDSVTFNRITLKSDINSPIEGTYVSIVNTTAGTTNVSITLDVQDGPDPQISIIAPTDYPTNFSANGETVTVRCIDTQADPLPSFSWSFNGSLLDGSEDYATITTGNEGRESYLNITVDPDFNGALILCTSRNTVEDEPQLEQASALLKVLAPPPPPTNLTVSRIISSCRVELSWVPPPSVDASSTLPPTFYQIEARAGGEEGYWVVGRIDSSYTASEASVKKALGQANVTYDFRISSGNDRGGVSPVSTATNTNSSVELFFDTPEAVTTVTVSTPTSSPSTSLTISWTTPPLECFLFLSHSARCTRSSGREYTSEPVPNSASSSTTVTGLAPDSSYSCIVFSTVTDLKGGEFPTVTSSSTASGFTYPDYPMEPAPPEAVVPPGDGTFPSTNITVQFSLPSDHSNISHYQILVLRVRSETDLPVGHPDENYPRGYPFLNESAVNNHTLEKSVQGPYIAAEIAGLDFSGFFVIGGGQDSKYSPLYRNGPLLSGTKYSCFLRAFPRSSVLSGRSRRQTEEGERQYLIFRSSDYMPVQETGSEATSGSSGSSLSPTATGIIIAGVIVSLILVVALVLILVLVYSLRRRRGQKYHLEAHSASLSSSSKGSMDIPHDTTPELCRKSAPIELKPLDLGEEESELVPSGAIPVNAFREHVEKFDENRQLLFQREFDWIQVNAPDPPGKASSQLINDDKNRYSNIKAFDHSRVVMTPVEGEDGSDYINANFIPGYKRTKEYISTQGPLEQTVADLWKMVWEQNTVTIVMLTNLVEAGKVKCAQYWPSPALGSITYGDIDVKLDNVAELRDYIVRNFTVTHVPSSRRQSVLQFHYTKWPDYGTPKLAAPLLNFLRAVHSSNPADAGPILVHCSAGVGRSGTVICIDYCLAKLKADRIIDVRAFVSIMREHRNYMVQTETQYAFIHYAILEAITYGDTSFTLSDFSQSYQQLQQKSKETGKTVLEGEYGRLGSVKTMSKASTFVHRVKQKGPTNRSIHYPGHASYSEGPNPHEYNAHFIDGYFTPKLFVVADGPQEKNAGKFWQMIWDQDCSYIIMLTPFDAEYYRYWPTAKGENETYGNIKVTVEEESAEHYYTTRVISIANAKLGVSQKVTQYQFVGWTSAYLPPVPSFVSFVCDVLEGVEGLQRNQKALIHDTNSLGQSGIFCSLCFCIERLRVERIVDVFQAVQSMQLQRPGTVQSRKEYAFIYDSVYEYIRTHLLT